MRAILIVICAAVSCLAAEPSVRSLFPPEHQSLTAAQENEFLRVVCPGHIAQHGCNACPEESADSPETGKKAIWTIVSAMTGHFTSVSAENVLLAMNGCEPHANNFGGSVSLTRQAGKWERTWYEGGTLTNSCRKILLASKREILFCEGGYMGSGTLAQSLYTLDFALPSEKRYGKVITVEDTMNACISGATLRKAFIEKVEFPDLDGDGVPDLRVTVQSGLTKKLTDSEIEKMCPDKLPQPALHRYTVEYFFRSDHFVVTAANRSLLDRFE